MGWTAPDTFSVSEVVTAAKMNLNIRDNLNYLRGLAGAVNIRSSLAITDVGSDITPANLLHVHSTTTAAGKIKLSSSAPGFELQDNVTDASRTMYGGLGFGTSAGHFGGGAGDMNFYTAANAGSQTNGIRFSTARDTSGNYAERLFVPGGYATGVGRVGINMATPQGPLHVAGAGGGFVFLSVTGLNATLQTISGNFVTRGTGMFIGDISTSGGTDWSYGKILSPQLNNFEDYTTADGDVIRVSVTAGGAITVQRQSGTFTHQINILCCYY